ncbi:MAG TPA: DUF493 domain-containing protein [Geopsychrobacteraceae bacterium]|jgi:hypothetical protein
MTERPDPATLLEFPCHYQFKAVGMAGDAFRDAVVATIAHHVAVAADAVRSRPSGKGRYQSVSVLVTLHSFAQLKDIYAGLRQVRGLKMLL